MRFPLHVFAVLSSAAAAASLFASGVEALPAIWMIWVLAWLLSVSAGLVDRMSKPA